MGLMNSNPFFFLTNYVIQNRAKNGEKNNYC